MCLSCFVQLACAHIKSKEGENYLKAMAAAANYAWVNRSSMTFLTRQVIHQVPVSKEWFWLNASFFSKQAFAKAFKSTPDDLDMHIIYDVSHNIAKVGVYHALVQGPQMTCV